MTAALLLPSIQPVMAYAQTTDESKTVSANEVVSENNASQEAETDVKSVQKEEVINELTDKENSSSGELTTQTLGSASPANPVHNCTTDTDSTGDTGDDVWVNGTKYRRIASTDTNYSGYFGDSTYRYFKWERIKWRVLQNNGSDLFVMADRELDCKCYNEEWDDVTWETSTLRKWLNDSFLKTAFSSAEQEAILDTTVVNDDNATYGTEGGNNTTDKVYLLSIAEVTSESYGFCSCYYTHSVSRRLKKSDYAYVRGALQETDSDYAGNRYWWLRSPGYNSDNAALVEDDGYVDSSGDCVDAFNGGVVAALHLNLSSDLWYLTDDGTSGVGGSENTDETSVSVPAKKGTKITDTKTNATFKVTSSSKKNPTVEYVAPKNKKKKTVTIPTYVSYKGVKYKVTSVAAKAFRNNKKVTTIKLGSAITKIGKNAFENCTSLKTVTVGTGLKEIGANAFKNCKKIKKLTIKSKKLKKVGKNAFKGINAKAVIKVPSSKLKAYKKLMKNKGQKKTVKIKK